MKKSLLGIFLASVMVQPVMAGLVPVANVKLDGSCYEFSLIATAPVVAAQPAACAVTMNVNVLYSTRVEAQKRGDGAVVLGSTVYSIVDSDNVYRQLRISDKLPI
jgi:hypothetical protein